MAKGHGLSWYAIRNHGDSDRLVNDLKEKKRNVVLN